MHIHITGQLDVVLDFKHKNTDIISIMKGRSCCGLIWVNLPVSSLRYVILLLLLFMAMVESS